jgi:hypothetical protein
MSFKTCISNLQSFEGGRKFGLGGKGDVPPQSHISSLSLFKPSRCLGRAAMRLSRALAWSGIMTSHSWSGVGVDDDIVRWIEMGMRRVKCVGMEEARRRRRRGSI